MESIDYIIYMIRNGRALEAMMNYPQIRNNQLIVKLAVSKEGKSLRYASHDLCDNLDIVIPALENNIQAIEFVSDRLKCDPDIVHYVLSKDGFMSCFLPMSQDNIEHMTIAVNQNGQSLMNASPRLKADKEFVMYALSKTTHGSAFYYIDKSLMKDKEIVIAALAKDISVYLYIDDELKYDKDVLELCKNFNL